MAEYITREDLEFPYMTMTLWGLNHETCHAYNEGVKAAADYIASLPAADVETVKRGKWLSYNPRSYYEDRFWCCSECKTLGSPRWKRCPVCEAKMEVEDG